jgi:hypothetical protein
MLSIMEWVSVPSFSFSFFLEAFFEEARGIAYGLESRQKLKLLIQIFSSFPSLGPITHTKKKKKKSIYLLICSYLIQLDSDCV